MAGEFLTKMPVEETEVVCDDHEREKEVVQQLPSDCLPAIHRQVILLGVQNKIKITPLCLVSCCSKFVTLATL